MPIDEDRIHITLSEGGSRSFIKDFEASLGGTETEHSLIIDKGPVGLQLYNYTIEGVEFTFAELSTIKPLFVTRSPDHNPSLIHLNIITDATFTRSYQEEISAIDSNSYNNVFLFNALFPSEVSFPSNTRLKYLGYSINLQDLGPLYEGLGEVFSHLFNEEEGLAFNTDLSKENHGLVSDIFAFSQMPIGAIPLISARALEILTNVVLHFKKEVDRNELAGLHLEDFNRLNAIKQKILSNLETSFTIVELSRDFGLSPTKLKKDFKHLFGTSVYQYYTLARMDEAYRRLKSGEFSVSEVGYDLGYSSLSKFSSMFKKVKGILPTEVIRMK